MNILQKLLNKIDEWFAKEEPKSCDNCMATGMDAICMTCEDCSNWTDTW